MNLRQNQTLTYLVEALPREVLDSIIATTNMC